MSVWGIYLLPESSFKNEDIFSKEVIAIAEMLYKRIS